MMYAKYQRKDSTWEYMVVSSVPNNGSDWGYNDKPLALSTYWQHRFKKHCQTIRVTAIFTPTSPETA